MNVNDFRTLAMSMPDAVEKAHMGTPDFRVNGGRIFATLYGQERGCAMVKLTPAQQADVIAAHPRMFQPIKGGWGRQGATQVNLKPATAATIRRVLRIAWRNAAPDRVLNELILAPTAKSKRKSPARSSPARAGASPKRRRRGA